MIDRTSCFSGRPSHRLGYDDFNESLTHRDVVYGVLAELRVTPRDIATGAANDAYQSLSSLGFKHKTYIDNKFDPQVGGGWGMMVAGHVHVVCPAPWFCSSIVYMLCSIRRRSRS